MTQDEVDMIYDYLHANYRYEDGVLVRKKHLQGSQVGRKLGSFRLYPEGNGINVCRFKVNGIEYSKSLSNIIYFFHHKVMPKYVKFIDGNKTNSKIENLKISSTRVDHSSDDYINSKTGYSIEKRVCGLRYRVRLEVKGKKINIGTFKSPEEARNAYINAKKQYA